MSSCTWIDCNNPASHPQFNRDGVKWANLCEGHHNELDFSIDDAIENEDYIKKMLSNWVKANGGAKEMASKRSPCLQE